MHTGWKQFRGTGDFATFYADDAKLNKPPQRFDDEMSNAVVFKTRKCKSPKLVSAWCP